MPAKSGFSSERWESWCKALIAHGQHGEMFRSIPSEYGVKHKIEGSLLCANGRSPLVPSFWQIDNDGLAPGLISSSRCISKRNSWPSRIGMREGQARGRDHPLLLYTSLSELSLRHVG
ncbi:DUF6883 domain-containing protein [Thalassobacterium maritimum]|uniref:DUF6883 domain-containing protein n=1 Tax=Thalassobacterium maritimum TaxID=3041265 RepID=UPI003CE4CDFB